MAKSAIIHPAIVLHCLKKWHYEYRLHQLAHNDEKREWKEFDDVILEDWIPKSASFSGWMRNQREANEFEFNNRALRERRYDH